MSRTRKCAVCGRRKWINPEVYQRSLYTVGGRAGWVCDDCRAERGATDVADTPDPNMTCGEVGSERDR